MSADVRKDNRLTIMHITIQNVMAMEDWFVEHVFAEMVSLALIVNAKMLH